MAVDYGVYLVTDSTPAILGSRSLAGAVEASLRGGAGVVQYRDKTASHDDAVRTARELLAVTRRFGVPLLVNDRVEVAVEVGCEGVHIGQDDMEFQKARQMLGPDKIIGVTASSTEEALRACEAGATYLGLGTVYATQTKKDTKAIIGPHGVRDILAALAAAGHASVPTVCIGGINASNAGDVLLLAAAATTTTTTSGSTPAKSLDGVAVVSALVAAPDPADAARHLLGQVLRARVPDVVRSVAATTPLSHNMTNLVVQNIAANVALAVGASPIMANYAEEAADLARLGGALVVNMGTVTPDGLKNYLQALKAYNDAGRPVILDPVGAGATAVRRSAVETLLSSGRYAVIKGNASEMLVVRGGSGPLAQRGVDSTSQLTLAQRASLARDVARRHRCVALVTGATDLLSDGRRVVRVDNGHELLGMITGSGCTLGTAVSAMVCSPVGAAEPLAAAVAATVMFGIAAEMAAERPEVRGPGTFVPAFLDELYSIRKATAAGDLRWLVLAKVQAIDVPEDDASP
ncbi:thiamine biosynthetic bifunctional enzyme [Purpureocillium takamizusanense]|uniref:Thiamine biosynthetic bifunctional enzyme n=1 Tax=Purpureocillium takamizusanense TaxID=2060973 RepID=A0A9Q8Q820_9HYPO|nr:thiamine biosynthetic bifunctional enzyme [Purpureocillium takamizusanense]UNI14176.1 thiamine biosynthetic bifunctional enzyme [Purpureocillium takamizusanense]